jgi:hypothetical protein
MASLLLTASCDACKQMPLGKEKERANVRLETRYAGKLGSVNNDQLVIEIEGRIHENQIKDSSTLCVVLIPEEETICICSAVSEFRDIEQPLDKNNLYVLLPKSKGAVYYGSDLIANKKGIVSTKVLLQGGLQAGNYKAYLIVHSITYGTYCSSAGQAVEIPDVGLDALIPTIKMESVAPKITIDFSTNKPIVTINAHATARNCGQKKGGFLFIEEKDAQINPIRLLADLIKDKRSIPITTGFQQMDGMPGGVIVHSFTSANADAKEDKNYISANDIDHIFKKGITYQVYAYLVEEGVDSGELNFVVSEKNIVFTIPTPEAKLQMAKSSIKIIQDLDRPLGKINMNLVGKIDSMKNVNNPQLGFLFVEGTLINSYEDAVNDIELLLNEPNVDGFHKKDIKPNIIYAGAIGGNLHIGEQPFNLGFSRSPFELGKEYYIYFWLKDGSGEIFVSGNSYTTLLIPKVELKVEEFKFNRLGYELIIGHKEEIKSNQPAPAIMGYLLCQEESPQVIFQIFEGISQYIGDLVVSKSTNKSPNLISLDKKVAFLDLPTLNDKQMFTAECNRMFGENVPDSTRYTPYLMHATESAIFYRKALEGKHFTWYKPNHKVDRTPVNVDIDGNGEKKPFEVSYTIGSDKFTSIKIMEKSDVGDVEQWTQVTLATDGSNKEKIKKIMSQIVRGDDADARIEEIFAIDRNIIKRERSE